MWCPSGEYRIAYHAGDSLPGFANRRVGKWEIDGEDLKEVIGFRAPNNQLG